jgi:hypothetical protein
MQHVEDELLDLDANNYEFEPRHEKAQKMY